MANAPNTSTFLTATDESADLPNCQQVIDSSTIDFVSLGSNQATFRAKGILANLAAISPSAAGILSATGSTGTIGTFHLASSGKGTLTISNADGIGGNPTFEVVDDTSVQRIQTYQDSVYIADSSMLNFRGTGGADVSVVQDAITGVVDVIVDASGGGGGGGAPANEYYVVTQTSGGTLTNEQNLGGLSSGLVVSTVASSISTLSTVPVSDFQPASVLLESIADLSPVAIGDVLVADSTTSFAAVSKGGNGTFLGVSGGVVGYFTPSGTLGPTLTSINSLNIGVGDLLVGIGVNDMTNLPPSSGSEGDLVTLISGTPVYQALEATVEQGGTGRTLLTTNSVLCGDGVNPIQMITGNDGEFFRATSGGAPEFQDLPLLTALIDSTPGTGYLTYDNTGGTFAYRQLQAGTGISISNLDGTANPIISVTSGSYQPLNANLTALSGINTNGFLVYTGSNTFSSVTFNTSSTITAINGSGGGTPSFAVIANTTQQKVGVSANGGAAIGPRQQIRFVDGTNTTVTVANNANPDIMDVTYNSTLTRGIFTGEISFSSGSNPTQTISNPNITAGCVIFLTPNPTTGGGNTFPEEAILPWKVDNYVVGTSATAKLIGDIGSTVYYKYTIIQ